MYNWRQTQSWSTRVFLLILESQLRQSAGHGHPPRLAATNSLFQLYVHFRVQVQYSWQSSNPGAIPMMGTVAFVRASGNEDKEEAAIEQEGEGTWFECARWPYQTTAFGYTVIRAQPKYRKISIETAAVEDNGKSMCDGRKGRFKPLCCSFTSIVIACVPSASMLFFVNRRMIRTCGGRKPAWLAKPWFIVQILSSYPRPVDDFVSRYVAHVGMWKTGRLHLIQTEWNKYPPTVADAKTRHNVHTSSHVPTTRRRGPAINPTKPNNCSIVYFHIRRT